MLSLCDIAFTFSDNRVRAIDNLSLELAPGKIHAVIGENGAGKSTLARLCTGHLRIQGGSIQLAGNELAMESPASGLDAGLALVPQHPRLAAGLTVWQNLVLGRLPAGQGRGRLGRLKLGPLQESLQAKLVEWGIHLPLDIPAGRLDAAHMHWAAIAEALLAKPRYLFLDEPSAPYSPQEVERLYRLLERCAQSGMCVVVITHKLQEVLDWADEVHVLRHGHLVAQFPAGPELNIKQLLGAMFGEAGSAVQTEAPLNIPASSELSLPPAAKTGLVVQDLVIKDGAGRILNKLSLVAPAGQITGLIGIKDQGLDILEDILAGLVRQTSGSINWEGLPLRLIAPHERAYIPGKRFQRGIATGLSIADNLASRYRLHLYPFNRLSRKRRDEWRNGSRFTVDRAWSDLVTTLSGGMIQRLIFERELDSPVPGLVICCEPYWGLDRHFQSVLRQRLLDLAARGATVLILSSDLDEAMDIADRLIVIQHGRQVLSVEQAQFDRANLAQAMVDSPRGAKP